MALYETQKVILANLSKEDIWLLYMNHAGFFYMGGDDVISDDVEGSDWSSNRSLLNSRPRIQSLNSHILQKGLPYSRLLLIN